MYAFPKINLPKKWLAACEEKGTPPDAAYCLEMLERTGVVVVPGSGASFGDLFLVPSLV